VARHFFDWVILPAQRSDIARKMSRISSRRDAKDQQLKKCQDAQVGSQGVLQNRKPRMKRIAHHESCTKLPTLPPQVLVFAQEIAFALGVHWEVSPYWDSCEIEIPGDGAAGHIGVMGSLQSPGEPWQCDCTPGTRILNKYGQLLIFLDEMDADYAAMLGHWALTGEVSRNGCRFAHSWRVNQVLSPLAWKWLPRGSLLEEYEY
jgi:hypothetical protein